jgi:cystine transport system substrate-binding protein
MKKVIIAMVALTMTISAFAAAKKEQPQTSLDRIKAAGALAIGIEGTYPPYTYHDETNALTGFDVEIAKAIAEKLGVQAKFVESRWDSLIIGLDTKLWDVVINQVGLTAERKEKYDFSIPYTYTRGALIVRADDTSINAFSDLAGKKSAQTVTSNWARLAEQSGAELVGTDGFNQSIDLVLSGRADATINDDVTYYDYKKQHPDSLSKIAALAADTTASAVILAKNQPELLQAINNALTALQADGTLKALSVKYFGEDVSVLSK